MVFIHNNLLSRLLHPHLLSIHFFLSHNRRDQVKENFYDGDHNTTLTKLMRFPQMDDVSPLLILAGKVRR